MSTEKYYQIFENRKPYQPARFSLFKDSLFQIVAIVFLFVGADYLYWRWQHSINWDVT